MKVVRPLLIATLSAALAFAVHSDAQQDSSLKSLNDELLKAAQQGNTARIRTLLDEGADQKDQALLAAAQQGKSEAIKLLLDRGANIDARDNNGETAVIYAAGYPQSDALKVLLDHGANADVKDNSHETALIAAARYGNTGSITLLLARAKFTAEERKAAVFVAAESEPMVIELRANELPPNLGQGQLIPPAPSFSPPDYAGAVKLLLEGGGMSVDVRDDYDQETLLIRAASHGQTRTVKMLLEMGASVDASDNSGDTPLHAAACECAVIDMPDTLESMRLLLDAGANVEAREKDGDTPLMRAAGWGQMDNVKLLLDRGAIIDARDNHGDTALTLAASANYGSPAGTVGLLVEHGANVNAANQDGNTPLILLASAPYYTKESDISDTVRLLLSHGADPRLTSRKGQNALSAARQSGQAGAAGLLQESLAKYH